MGPTNKISVDMSLVVFKCALPDPTDLLRIMYLDPIISNYQMKIA